MNAKAERQTPTQRRSGSEKRQRPDIIPVRCSPEERVTLKANAAAAGLSAGSYLRLTGLGNVGVRAKRAPTVNAEAMARATAALNKVGSNLNQIAHVLNAGKAAGSAETLAAVAEVRAVLAHFRASVGMSTQEP
jgi:hypothetical protein